MLFLGTADLIAALLLVRSLYSLPISIPAVVIFVFAIYLFLKALIFIADVGSWLDIATGILLILTLSATLPQLLLIIFALLVGMKGVLTIFAGFR